MQLLFVDRKLESARSLHGEFLSCRGFQWDLTHCQSAADAMERIEHQEFQAVLYRGHDGFEAARCDLGRLLTQPNCPPVISVLDPGSIESQFCLIEQGAHYTLTYGEVTGPNIMRQLRMADQRQAAWQRTVPILDLQSLPRACYEASDANQQSSPNPDGISSGGPCALLPREIRIAHLYQGKRLFSGDSLYANRSYQIQFEQLKSLDELTDKLHQSGATWHAILIEQSILEELRPEAIRELLPFLATVPTTVLTLEKSDYTALTYLDRGFADCLVAEEQTTQTICDSIAKTIVRHRRQLIETLSQQTVGSHVSDRRKTVRMGSNRRRHVRFIMSRPFLAIPMLPGGAPDREHMANAMSIDVSLGGLGLALPRLEQIPSRNWIIGLEGRHGQFEFASAYLRRITYESDALRIGVVFQSGDEDFFCDRNLVPDLDPQTKQLKTWVTDSNLRQWVDLGVLRRDLITRIHVCPECHGTCAVGPGCSECGSPRFQHQDLIHHFACAHVGHASQFQHSDHITCPKCLQADLVVGADFEVIKSRYDCPDCQHQGNQLIDVGHCLNCQLRFPLNLSPEREVQGYHVRRLDILALVDEAR